MALVDKELERLRGHFLSSPGVVGVGKDDSDGVIVVMVERANDLAIIEELNRAANVPVRGEVVGNIQPHQPPQIQPGGVLDHAGGCTMGIPAHKDGDPYFVTAFHCLDALRPGDTVNLGGQPAGTVTHVPTMEHMATEIPAAQIDSDHVAVRAEHAQPVRLMEQINKPILGEPYVPATGEVVTKEGNTSGVTSGEVLAKDIVIVSDATTFGIDGNIFVGNLASVRTQSQAGDSGGPIVREFPNHCRPVGFLYGGAPGVMFYTQLPYVQEQTGLSFAGQIPQLPDDGTNGENGDDGTNGDNGNGSTQPPDPSGVRHCGDIRAKTAPEPSDGANWAVLGGAVLGGVALLSLRDRE